MEPRRGGFFPQPTIVHADHVLLRVVADSDRLGQPELDALGEAFGDVLDAREVNVAVDLVQLDALDPQTFERVLQAANDTLRREEPSRKDGKWEPVRTCTLHLSVAAIARRLFRLGEAGEAIVHPNAHHCEGRLTMIRERSV